MRPPPVFIGLIAPVSLLLLVVALARCSTAGSVRSARPSASSCASSLDRRAREFADDFDREISRAYQTSSAGGRAVRSRRRRRVRRSSTRSGRRRARFPGSRESDLLRAERRRRARSVASSTRACARSRPANGRRRSSRCGRVCRARRALGGGGAAGSDRRYAAASSAYSSSLGRARRSGDRHSGVLSRSPNRGRAVKPPSKPGVRGFFVALRLRTAISSSSSTARRCASTVLPALAERHFPETGADRFRVVDRRSEADRRVMTRGLRGRRALDPEKADATGVVLRSPASRRCATRHGDGGRTTTRGADRRAHRGRRGARRTRRHCSHGFSMMVEQRATPPAIGAPPQAVEAMRVDPFRLASAAAARRRIARCRGGTACGGAICWLSFGILGVLVASVGLIVVNARRSERLAAQQMDFVATVSHELRTPLAVIRSAAQNLSAGVVHDAEQAQRYGDLIEDEGRRLTDMVEQVLEYAGPAAATGVPVDGAAGRRRRARRATSWRRLSAAARGRGVHSSRCDVAGRSAAGDGRRGRDPARAAEPGRQRAQVRAPTADGSASRPRRGTARDAATKCRSPVSDRGRGIAAEDLAHIFEPFYRGRLRASIGRSTATASG